MQKRHLESETAKTRTEEKKLVELGDGEPSSGLPLKNCIEPECDEIGTHLDHSPLTPFGEQQLCQTPAVSNDPAPKYADYAEAIAYHDALAKWVLRNFESGQMSAGRLACVFDCVEFATKQRESGAAQEVSPRIISRETFPELGGETTVEVFEEVSPPSPPRETDGHPVGWCCKHCYDGGYQAAMRLFAEGDTRELKAALRWIPVEEKLPDTTDSYLVWVRGIGDDGEMFQESVEAVFSHDIKHWTVQHGWLSHEVQGWMPMPKPPELG